MLESDRWLGLAHPAERLAYIVLLLKADDLATADASDGQLVRLWREPCNLKGPEDAQRLLNALADADLVRIYEADGKRLVFIPRFRQRFRARTLKRPPPPENLLKDEPEIFENIRQINNRVREMTDNRQTYVGQLAGNGQTVAPVGVGVGVGVGEGEGSVEPAAPVGAPNVWDLGVSLLTSTGTGEAQARSFIGKLIKQHGEPATLSAVADAVNKRPAEPRGWITKALQTAAKKQASSDIYTPARKAAGGSP
jgi:hypothetical protein